MQNAKIRESNDFTRAGWVIYLATQRATLNNTNINTQSHACHAKSICEIMSCASCAHLKRAFAGRCEPHVLCFIRLSVCLSVSLVLHIHCMQIIYLCLISIKSTTLWGGGGGAMYKRERHEYYMQATHMWLVHILKCIMQELEQRGRENRDEDLSYMWFVNYSSIYEWMNVRDASVA